MNPTKEEKETQKRADLQAFEAEIRNVAKEFPTHEKKEFTFTLLERQMLAQQATIEALARQSQTIIINEQVIKRLGFQPNPQMRVRYSVGLGRFVIFLPKGGEKK